MVMGIIINEINRIKSLMFLTEDNNGSGNIDSTNKDIDSKSEFLSYITNLIKGGKLGDKIKTPEDYIKFMKGDVSKGGNVNEQSVKQSKTKTIKESALVSFVDAQNDYLKILLEDKLTEELKKVNESFTFNKCWNVGWDTVIAGTTPFNEQVCLGNVNGRYRLDGIEITEITVLDDYRTEIPKYTPPRPDFGRRDNTSISRPILPSVSTQNDGEKENKNRTKSNKFIVKGIVGGRVSASGTKLSLSENVRISGQMTFVVSIDNGVLVSLNPINDYNVEVNHNDIIIKTSTSPMDLGLIYLQLVENKIVVWNRFFSRSIVWDLTETIKDKIFQYRDKIKDSIVDAVNKQKRELKK